MVQNIVFQRNEPSVSLKVAMLSSAAFLDNKNYTVVPFLDMEIPIKKGGTLTKPIL